MNTVSSFPRERKIEMTQIEYIEPNPFQVREIDPTKLGSLVNSIRQYGFQGSLEVRYNPYNPSRKKQLVAGHRRLRAAELAGLTTVPTVTADRNDAQMRELAYIENATIEPLSYWDEAVHLKQLQDSGLTMSEIAELISKSKGYVQGRLDLLRLPEGPIREAAQAGQVEMSIFSVLLTMPEDLREELFARAKTGELNASDLRAIRSNLNNSVIGDQVTIGEHGERIHTVPILQAVPPATELCELDPDPDLAGPDPATLLVGVGSPVIAPQLADQRTTITKMTPDHWNERLLVQLRGIVPNLEATMDHVDLNRLQGEEQGEVEQLSARLGNLVQRLTPVRI